MRNEPRRIVSQLRDSDWRPREAEVEERDAERGSRMYVLGFMLCRWSADDRFAGVGIGL